MSAEPMADLPRRLTPMERNHELLKLALERPAPASASAAFHGAQTKAVGGATVNEWDVQMPVCAEFPSADEAFAAFKKYVGEMRELFPPSTNGSGE